MCEQLTNDSLLQLRWVEHLFLVFPKPIIAMQQIGVILMEEHDHEWCAYISQKKVKTTNKIISQKLRHHMEGTLGERHGERIKVELNVFFFKSRFISRWKSLTKGGRSTLTNGWKWWWVVMVLVERAVGVLGANAHIVQTYSPTWASAHVWNNHVNGSGVRSNAISKDLWEANACALIVCSSCNVSQSPTMYQHKQVGIFWWFLLPHGENDKHHE
jgi:hypothetical protein